MYKVNIGTSSDGNVGEDELNTFRDLENLNIPYPKSPTSLMSYLIHAANLFSYVALQIKWCIIKINIQLRIIAGSGY